MAMHTRQSALETGATQQTYLREDPKQGAFRTLVALLDDAELVDLENDLDMYLRCGLVSDSLDQILSDAQDCYRQVA